jgi:hypothetical protein
MRKLLGIAALALSVSTAAFAQSGNGSSGTSGGMPTGQGSANTPGTQDRLPGATNRSRISPGANGRVGATSRPRGTAPSGPSAAGEVRRGSAGVDLNQNSATGAIPPGGAVGSGAADRSRPLAPGTGAVDTTVPDSSVYNPGLQR